MIFSSLCYFSSSLYNSFHTQTSLNVQFFTIYTFSGCPTFALKEELLSVSVFVLSSISLTSPSNYGTYYLYNSLNVNLNFPSSFCSLSHTKTHQFFNFSSLIFLLLLQLLLQVFSPIIFSEHTMSSQFELSQFVLQILSSKTSSVFLFWFSHSSLLIFQAVIELIIYIIL